jgi:multidrug efflux pump subunit AcrA (membrane-fusion protein)
LRQESNDTASLSAELKKAITNQKRAQTRARKAVAQSKQDALARREAETAQAQAEVAVTEAEVQLAEQESALQRAEQETEVARKHRRIWLSVAGLLLVVAVTAVGMFVTREKLPGVAPENRTTCPSDHPIKGNRSQSGSQRIYHVPGGAFYDRTTPVRCFATEDEAVAAGYRRSQR